MISDDIGFALQRIVSCAYAEFGLQVFLAHAIGAFVCQRRRRRSAGAFALQERFYATRAARRLCLIAVDLVWSNGTHVWIPYDFGQCPASDERVKLSDLDFDSTLLIPR